jgi:three-Cys-motif partner protein
MSTPLLIVESALRDPKIYSKIKLVFNDENFEYINQLQIEMEQLDGYEKLAYKPIFLNKDVSEITGPDVNPDRIPKPTLLFIDPFGYNGLALGFFNILKSWGSDVIFFFNYRRINMSVSNPVFRPNMIRLFGEEIFLELESAILGKKMTPTKREQIITDAIIKTLQAYEPSIIKPLHYRFRNQTGNRTTHHLFLATKSVAGYTAMKEIMVKQSSDIREHVGQLEYNPRDRSRPRLMLDFSIPELKESLLAEFAGHTETVQQIYYRHNIGRPYVEKNYKDALRQLEDEGKIIASPDRSMRPSRKGIATMADIVRIKFPTN